MAAWGVEAFECDEGLDFAADVQDAAAWTLVQQALERAAGEKGDLEIAEGTSAVAAAALVAGQDPGGRLNVLKALGPAPSGLAPLARSALARVTAPRSELNELWAETQDYAAWKRDLARLDSLLEGRA